MPYFFVKISPIPVQNMEAFYESIFPFLFIFYLLDI